MYMLYIYIFIAIYLFTALNKALHFIALRFNSHTAQKVSVFGVILVRIFSAFSRIRTEYGEIVRISPYSVQGKIWEKCGTEEFRIRTLFNAVKDIYKSKHYQQ